MSVLSLNISSFPEHINEFLDQCLPSPDLFDIMGFTETKLSNDIQNLHSIPNFSHYCNNRSRNSGGVALYIKNKYTSYARPELTFLEDYIESVFIEIKAQPNNIIVGQIYRRPKTNINNFMEKLSH